MGNKTSGRQSAEDLRPYFEKYVRIHGREGVLTSPGFKQWLAEAQIMGENTIVTVLDAEKVIASNVEDRENMDFEIFNKCVKALIKEKNLNVAKITNKLAAVAKALPS